MENKVWINYSRYGMTRLIGIPEFLLPALGGGGNWEVIKNVHDFMEVLVASEKYL